MIWLFRLNSSILHLVVVIPKSSTIGKLSQVEVTGKKVTNTAKDNNRRTDIKRKSVAAVDRAKHKEKRGKTSGKFHGPDDLTITIENNNQVKKQTTGFKAKNYKEHKAYNELKPYIDRNNNDNKRTIDKLTDALVKIAARPDVVNINQNKNQFRRSKKISRK